MAEVVSSCLLLLATSLLVGVNCVCPTPDSKEGECMNINECKPLLDLYNNLTSLDGKARKFLHKSQCGYTDLDPKVCCPKGDKPFVLQRPVVPIMPDLGSRFGETLEEKIAKGRCGIQYTTERIFDGTITEIDEFPWMALLIYQTEHGPAIACGGALISDKYVLTAAHCVTSAQVEKLGKLIAVRLGEYDLQTSVDCDDTTEEIEEYCAPPPHDILIESSHPHPDYKVGAVDRHHDIALVRLSSPANFTKYIQPICLPSETHDSSINKPKSDLVICGWGKTEKSEGSAIKLKARVPLVEENECKNPYEAKGIRIAKTQLCAGDGKHDSCKGDSGGPLMLEDLSDPVESRWYAVGIISFGSNPCAKQGVPAVYTRVWPYLEWIKSTMKP